MSLFAVLLARYTVKEGYVEEVLEKLKTMEELVKQREPDCLHYEISRSREHHNQLALYEVYRDQAAMDAHALTPHFEEIVKGQIIPLLQKREREFLDIAIRSTRP